MSVIDVNTAAHFEAYFAAARLDAIYVPLNFRGRGDEIGFPLRSAAPRALIAGERYVPLVDGLRGDAASVALFAVDGAAYDGWRSYAEVVAGGSDDELRFPGGSPEDTAALVTGFLSG